MPVTITRVDTGTYDKPSGTSVWVLLDDGWQEFRGVRYALPLTVCEGFFDDRPSYRGSKRNSCATAGFVCSSTLINKDQHELNSLCSQ